MTEALGDALPKQYLALAGRTVLEHSLHVLLAHPRIEGVMLALAADDEHWQTLAFQAQKPVLRCDGGAERSDSVRACLLALQALGVSPDFVAVHDAARPCLSDRDLNAVLDAALQASHGAILATPLSDSLKRADAHRGIEASVPRSGLWLAQTPQVMRFRDLLSALTLPIDGSVTDEASAVERLGLRPVLVAAQDPNPKLTYRQDLAWAEFLLAGTSTRAGAARRDIERGCLGP